MGNKHHNINAWDVLPSTWYLYDRVDRNWLVMGLGLATSSLAHTLLHPTTAKRKIGKNSEKKKHGRWVLLVTAGTKKFDRDLFIRLSLLSRWKTNENLSAKDGPNEWQWPFPILTNERFWNSCFWWKRLWSTSLRCEGNLNATKYEHLNKEEEDEETMRMWQERWAVQMRTVFATAVLSDDGGRWGLWCQWLDYMLNACCIEKLKTFFLII